MSFIRIRRRARTIGVLCGIGLLSACTSNGGGLDSAAFEAWSNATVESGFIAPADYDFPIDNPLTATIVGTPNRARADLGGRAPLKPGLAQVLPNKKIPDLFWYIDGFPYTLAAQDKPAPLMFVIGGFGAGHLSSNMLSLGDTFFTAGYHVVLLPSPSFMAFIVAGSKESLPGRLATDVDDLITAIGVIKRDLSQDLDITGVAVSGYSLGGIHALFIAERASRTQELDIVKTIAINPPVNLLESVGKLDRMLRENIPGGADNPQAFHDHVFGKISEFYSTTESLDFSDDFLFRLQRDQQFDDQYMAALIGMSFRLSLASMFFTSDVVGDRGFMKPKGYELSTAQPLLHYYQASVRFSFDEYIDDYLVPHFRAIDPVYTRDYLSAEADLKSIEDFLRGSDTTFLVTNADDIILKSGDIEYLASVFGTRALIFPKGGHLGNIDEKRMVSQLIALARGNEP